MTFAWQFVNYPVQCNCFLRKKSFQNKEKKLDLTTLLLLPKHRKWHTRVPAQACLKRILVTNGTHSFPLKKSTDRSRIDKYNTAAFTPAVMMCSSVYQHKWVFCIMKHVSCARPMLADSVKVEIQVLMRERRKAKKENNPITSVTWHKSVGHRMSHTPTHPRNAQAHLCPQVARADGNHAVTKQLVPSVRDKIW